MRIALDPDTIRFQSITDMVRQAADMGFEYIEQSPHPQIIPFYKHPKYNKDIINEYKAALKETGVKLSSIIPIYWWSHPDEQRRLAAVENWKLAIQFAVEMGIDLINTELGGDIKRPVESEEALYRSMDVLLPIFEKEGIRLDIQSHPYDFCENGNETVDIVRSFDSDHVKYLYPVPHAFFLDDGKGDHEAALDYAGKELKHVIFADTFNQEKYCRYIVNPPTYGRQDVSVHQHLGMGQGDVDFDSLFAKLKAMKFGLADDTVAAVSLFGFPERFEQDTKALRDRIIKELL